MTIKLRLLGKPRVFDGKRWQEAPLDKRFALLSYLACAGDWVERGKLAFLFWPDVEDTKAKRDLRYLLYRTKALGFAKNLETQPGNLCWRADNDLHSFRQALAEEAWNAAVVLYAGELLEGLSLADSPEFMAWLELERKNLHDAWREAVLKRTAELEKASRHLEATALAKPLVAADELDEDALQVYLRNAFLGGRRNDALETYRGFTHKLQEELGLEPLPATQELVQALQSGVTSKASALRTPEELAPRPHSLRNFPAESTSFIGRDLELTEIVNTLSQPDCRLLTLVGPGGIGKTRLALRAAADMAAGYGEGAAFVPLASLEASTLLASTIASALAFPLYGQDEPERQLLAYLRDKEMLLVLDNLEHLLEGTGLIAGMLETCPKLKLLATSRERLNLASEWLLRVEGMSLPESEGAGSLEGFDAVQLFLRRARRVRSDFLLHKENRAAVVDICRQVGGAPLGIELAAAWVQLLSCEEIAAEMTRDLDALSSPLRDMPERHRSLRRVFEHSWKLLLPAEQSAFRRLSVFQGGFTHEAGEKISNISMRLLLSLLDKSLVKRGADGRFYLHELVKRFAAEKLGETPEEQGATRDRHSAYYMAFLRERERWMKGGKRQQASLQEIEEEIDNVRSAWRWAVHRRDTKALEQAMESLYHFYYTRGLHREGEDAFRRAAESLEESVTLARLLARQGLFAWNLYQLELSEEVSRRSLAMFACLGKPPDVIALINLACAPSYRGELDLAKQRNFELLEASRNTGNLWGMALALNNLGDIANLRQAFERAEPHLRESIALFRQLDDRWGLAMALESLAYMHRGLGNLEAAEACYSESLTCARDIGVPLMIAHTLAGLGSVCLNRRQPERAEAYYLESLSVLRERGRSGPPRPTEPHLFWSLLGLGRTMHALKRHQEALAHFREGLMVALTHHAFAPALDAVVSAAELLTSLEEKETALSLLAFSLNQPYSEEDVREHAGRLYADLTAQLPEDVVASARTRGQAWQFAEITSLLAELQQQLKF